MRKLLRYSFALVLLLATAVSSRATHIVGGDLTYKYLGSNNYQIELYLYVDCINGAPSAIDQDKFAEIGVFNASNTMVQSLQLARTGPTRIDGKNYSCVIPPTTACVDLYVFKTTTTLLPSTGGYQLVFQRCCRNNTIENINAPQSTGSTYRTYIPDVMQYGFNSSAVFKGLPPNFLCTNEPLVFDHSATDPDGDRLVYELCNPLHGASTSDPLPIPVNNPPYTNVSWKWPYNVTNQMAGLPALSINSTTGELTVTPSVIGQFVVGVCVKEYRNNVLINTVLRDFQFNVVNCVFTITPRFTMPVAKCSNTINFTNTTTGGAVAYTWKFYDDTTFLDSSNSKDPSYTFPGPGKYRISLTAYNSNGCSREYSSWVHILPDLIPGLLPDSTVCYGTQIQLGAADPDFSINYLWTPSAGLDNPNASNPIATVTQNQKYTVKRSSISCFVEGEVELSIDPINADFIHEYLPPCDGLKVKFFNRSQHQTRQVWDFGDWTSARDTSTQDSSVWVYKDTGIVYVRLDVFNAHCKDSLIKPIRILFPDQFTAVIDTAICDKDAIRIGPLNDTSIMSFSWSSTRFMNDGALLYPTVTPDTSVSYTLTKVYATCTLKDSFVIRVNELPDFSVSRTGDEDICLGDSIMLLATGSPSYQYEWFPKAELSSPFSQNTWVKPTQTTLYEVRVVTPVGCTENDTITVPMYPQWTLDLPREYVICQGERFLPEIPIPDAIVRWTGWGTDIIYDSLSEEGYYVVTVTTKCQVLKDTIQVAHYVPQYCKLDFPNAFTPNGDGINDTYPFGGRYHEIFGIECDFMDYNLVIFNRWGEVVFRSVDPTQEWDGLYKNNNGNIDVFGYYLQYREFNWCTGALEVKVKWGNVSVLR
ncbi:MAG: PKD domain-containing protein [Bacteroidetes bacterium]|nr:MAG: PKD domain-containing protein [Bacteroidota bacterium]